MEFYAIRDRNGVLCGLTRWPNPFFDERISENSAEVTEYRARKQEFADIEEAIQTQMRTDAIQKMKADGKIDPDYPEPVTPDVKPKR